MIAIGSALHAIGTLDQLAMQDTFLHRLDPRAKLLTTAGLVLAVVSCDRYAIAQLLPFLMFPLSILILAQLPLRGLVWRMALAAPFAVCIGLFNPLLDTATLIQLPTPWGMWHLSGGWVSFLSIMLRFVLTVSAALMLVATTGFTTLCVALDRLGMPRVFVVQLLFLHRYLFVLVDEALRMARARSLRARGQRGMGARVLGLMLGQLLLRTLDRARHIHTAMLCRGFDGELRIMRTLAWKQADTLYTLGWMSFFALARLVDLPVQLGNMLLRIPL